MLNSVSAAPERQAPRRLHFLDLIRGIAAVLVIFDHSFNVPIADDVIRKYFDTGRLGVTTFFLVSGFVIPLTLERQASIRAFIVTRFFRLYPLFWLSLIGVVIWAHFGVTLSPPEYYALFETHFTRNMLVNATMLQELFHVPNAIPVFWTLTVELAFYVLCAIIYRLGYMRRSLQTAWIVVGLVFVVTVIVPSIRHHRVPFEHVFAFVTFFFGTAVYRHYQGAISTRQLRRLTVATLGLALLGTVCNYYLFTDSSEHVTAEASAFTYLAAFGGFFIAYTNRLRTFPRFLLFLGTISYSMYLLHPLVIELCVDRFGEFARFLIGLPATILLSTLTYKFLEVPMVAHGHRFATRFMPPKARLEAPRPETKLKASA